MEYKPKLPKHIQEKLTEKAIRKAKETMMKYDFVVVDNQGVIV